MQKFKVGEKVRKNLTTGVWDIIDYDEDSDNYTIHQEHTFETVDYPEPGTMIYHVATHEMEPIRNVTKTTLIYEETVKEENIQLAPDAKTLRMQEYLGLNDIELAVLRKIDRVNAQKVLPFSIPNTAFDVKEFDAIQRLIEKQYWFFTSEASVFGKGDFLSQDDNNVILIADVNPILKVYKDYVIS